MTWSRCAACGIVFGSLAAFDRHRVGGYGDPIYRVNKAGKKTKEVIGYTPPTRHCLSLEEVQTIMKQNAKGWWVLGMERKTREVSISAEEEQEISHAADD